MADDFADSIMDQVHSLEIGQLLVLCGQYNVVVSEEKKDKRGAVVRLLTKFVDEKLEADEADELGKLDGDIGKLLKSKVKPDKGLNAENADVVADEKVLVKDAGATGSKDVDKGTNGVDNGDLVRQKVDLLRGMRAREFKIDGSVGRKAGCIDWQNLQFQVKKGKTAGYNFDEIRNGVIKAMKAGSSMHRYFQNADDIEEDEFMEMLRNHYVIQAQNASTVFNEMVGSAQESDEEAGEYAFRVLEMCKSVVKLSLKEDHQWDSTLVRKSCLHALSVGFIEHTIRSDLREFLKDVKKTDNEILAEVSKAELRDAECKQKMKGKGAGVKGGAHASCSASCTFEGVHNNKFNNYNNNKYNSNKNSSSNNMTNNNNNNSNTYNNNSSSSNNNNNNNYNNNEQNNMNEQQNTGDISNSAENRILAAVSKVNDKVDEIGKVVSRVDKLEIGLEAVKEQLTRQQIPVIPALGGQRRSIKCQACELIPGSYCRHCGKCGQEGHKRKDCPN